MANIDGDIGRGSWPNLRTLFEFKGETDNIVKFSCLLTFSQESIFVVLHIILYSFMYFFLFIIMADAILVFLKLNILFTMTGRYACLCKLCMSSVAIFFRENSKVGPTFVFTFT